MYKLRVENENGSDEAEAELVVLSPSAKPMGPLECEDILGMDSIITFFFTKSQILVTVTKNFNGYLLIIVTTGVHRKVPLKNRGFVIVPN